MRPRRLLVLATCIPLIAGCTQHHVGRGCTQATASDQVSVVFDDGVVSTSTRGTMSACLNDTCQSGAFDGSTRLRVNGPQVWLVAMPVPNDSTIQVKVWLRASGHSIFAGEATAHTKKVSAERFWLPAHGLDRRGSRTPRRSAHRLIPAGRSSAS